MVGRGAGPRGVGRVTSGIPKSALASRTVSFVRSQLASWRDDTDRPEEPSEDALNAQLCKYLDSRARIHFPMVRFDREERQTGRRKVDLAASPVESLAIGASLHTIYDPILVLEGKRLPAPSSSREMEYVTGRAKRTGGIQRFKLGLHGAKMDSAAMIAYIQEHDSKHWHNTINGWISGLADGSFSDGCSWEPAELLRQVEEDTGDGVARYFSTHSRTSPAASPTVHLHHLWVVMNR